MTPSEPPRPKDRWDKAAILGGVVLPVIVAAVGGLLSWVVSRAQHELELTRTRVAQTGAVATLLDALSEEGCERNTRKRVAIRLVYYVLPADAADEVVLVVSGDPDLSCAASAVAAFQGRIAEVAPDLAAAQATLLAGGDDAAVDEALREVQASRFAPLVLPAILDAATRGVPDGGGAAALMRSSEVQRTARSSPLVARLGEELLRTEGAPALGLDGPAIDEWRDIRLDAPPGPAADPE